jgi:hypothetical protein
MKVHPLAVILAICAVLALFLLPLEAAGVSFVRIFGARTSGATVPMLAFADGSLAVDGTPTSVAGTDPAAGAEISETVPAGKRWRVLGIQFTLVTNANVANREPVIVVDDGTNTLFQSPAGANHAASLTWAYSASNVGQPVNGTTATTVRQMNLPALLLPAGSRIRTSTTNIQAGDNYGAPRLLVQEFAQ